MIHIKIKIKISLSQKTLGAFFLCVEEHNDFPSGLPGPNPIQYGRLITMVISACGK